MQVHKKLMWRALINVIMVVIAYPCGQFFAKKYHALLMFYKLGPKVFILSHIFVSFVLFMTGLNNIISRRTSVEITNRCGNVLGLDD